MLHVTTVPLQVGAGLAGPLQGVAGGPWAGPGLAGGVQRRGAEGGAGAGRAGGGQAVRGPGLRAEAAGAGVRGQRGADTADSPPAGQDTDGGGKAERHQLQTAHVQQDRQGWWIIII